MLISPLIKPGTTSSTYYNHYSTLRTLEDLFLTGPSCTEPSNADTPLTADPWTDRFEPPSGHHQKVRGTLSKPLRGGPVG